MRVHSKKKAKSTGYYDSIQQRTTTRLQDSLNSSESTQTELALCSHLTSIDIFHRLIQIAEIVLLEQVRKEVLLHFVIGHQ